MKTASPKMQPSVLAPKTSPIEVTQDMSAIQTMVMVINRTTDNVPSLQEDRLDAKNFMKAVLTKHKSLLEA